MSLDRASVAERSRNQNDDDWIGRLAEEFAAPGGVDAGELFDALCLAVIDPVAADELAACWPILPGAELLEAYRRLARDPRRAERFRAALGRALNASGHTNAPPPGEQVQGRGIATNERRVEQRSYPPTSSLVRRTDR